MSESASAETSNDWLEIPAATQAARASAVIITVTAPWQPGGRPGRDPSGQGASVRQQVRAADSGAGRPRAADSGAGESAK